MAKDEYIGERLTVDELIKLLQQFPKDMGVVDCNFNGITSASIHTWPDNGFPYNMPDSDYVMLES